MPKAKLIPSKRILSVEIKRKQDSYPDPSHLGEYSDTRRTEFSIDRMHSEDCNSVDHAVRDAKEKLERIGEHIYTLEQDSEGSAYDCIQELLGTIDDCRCGGHACSSREYRYFNPSFNYVDKNGSALPDNTPDEIRKYVREDYNRMEDLNNGGWQYIGIRAEAEIGIGAAYAHTSGKPIYTIQRITSGGLYGIESDSEPSYLEDIGKDELSDLRAQLSALGFSKRAISQAFKTVQAE